MGGFDEGWWASHWWLIFPIFGFAMAFLSVWSQHRRQRDWMQLMKTYAAQGKDPPASLANVASDHWRGMGSMSSMSNGYYGRRLPFFDVRRGVFFGALAGAFAYLYYHNPAHNEGFGIAAVILGALAVGYILISLIPRPKMDDTPPKSNGQ